MAIRILVTGGTIDKEYNMLNGELTFTETHLPRMLQQVNCKVPVSIESVLLVDSLLMRDEDRQNVLERCSASPEQRLVITHGTDTMCETAAVLGGKLPGKTAVLVGAMIPYSFGNSDALFNLGAAMTAVQILVPGVYITMNGRIFAWDNVRKNRGEGVFEELAPGLSLHPSPRRPT
jgi:L-asparaginase